MHKGTVGKKAEAHCIHCAATTGSMEELCVRHQGLRTCTYNLM
jgi:hypothetical protein